MIEFPKLLLSGCVNCERLHPPCGNQNLSPPGYLLSVFGDRKRKHNQHTLLLFSCIFKAKTNKQKQTIKQKGPKTPILQCLSFHCFKSQMLGEIANCSLKRKLALSFKKFSTFDVVNGAAQFWFSLKLSFSIFTLFGISKNVLCTLIL